MNGLFAKLSVLVALVLMLGTLTALGAWGPMAAAPREMIYVDGVQDVLVLDATGNSTLATIAVGGYINALAMSQTGAHVYALARNVTTGEYAVGVIDTGTNTLIGSIPLHLSGQTVPYDMAVNPAATHLYISTRNDGTNENRILDVDIASQTVIDTILLEQQYSNPVALVLNQDGTRLYVGLQDGLQGDPNILVVDTSTNSVIAALHTGANADAFVLSRDGRRLYVASGRADFTPNGDTVFAIDTLANTVVAQIVVGGGPRALALSQDGRRLYVVNAAQTVSVIETSRDKVVATIPVGINPYSAALNSVGNRLYVSSFNQNTLWIIDTVTRKVVDIVQVEQTPFDVFVKRKLDS